MKRMVEKNSMLYWYPKIKDLPIPQPRTMVVAVNPKDVFAVLDNKATFPEMSMFKGAAKKLGFPLFIRTDQLSGKHSWKETCFVTSQKDLMKNIYRVVEESYTCDIMGRDVNALVFREYIPMDSKYTAFWGGMPVSPERRYFVKNGNVVCHHPYWIEEAIVEPSVKNWRQLSKEMNTETKDEMELLTGYAKQVAKRFRGFWSVDFCKAKDGRWILIDMAVGEDSWHPKDCKFSRTIEIDYLKREARLLQGEDVVKVKSLT